MKPLYLVTGAASGIGLASTRKLCAMGAGVIAVDLGLAEALPEGAVAYSADVRDLAALREIVAQAAPEGLDGILCCAGIDQGGTIETTTPEEWERTLAINVTGSANAVNAALPALRQRKGAVVLCSSQLSMAGAGNCLAYAASKGAINAMCKAMALDLAPEGIRVNAIAPGATETPMMERAFQGSPEVREASRQRHAMGRFGLPEESAAAAVFLLSAEASFVTGTVLPIDGGWLAK